LDEIDDLKDSFYKELELAFDKFLKYHINILLGDFNAKLGMGDIFKPTVGNESLHEISNDKGVRIVNFATSKNLKSQKYNVTTSPHPYIYILGTSPAGKTHKQIDHILRDSVLNV
jgi:hypothetical protein